MNKNIKIATLALTLLVGIGIGAVSANGLTTTIEAIKDARVRVLLNGNFLDLRNADGKVLSPIMYEGSTYLPVRTISESLEIAVNWDGEKRQVILGELLDYVPLTPELFSQLKTSNTSGLKYVEDPEMLFTPQKSYAYGTTSGSFSHAFKLDSNYSRFITDVFLDTDHTSEKEMVVEKAVAGEWIAIKSFTLQKTDVESIDIDVSGVEQIRVRGNNTHLKLGEPKFK